MQLVYLLILLTSCYCSKLEESKLRCMYGLS